MTRKTEDLALYLSVTGLLRDNGREGLNGWRDTCYDISEKVCSTILAHGMT